MELTVQRLCLLAAPIAVLTFIAAFVGIAGFVPPSEPTLSAGGLVQFYEQSRNSIRVGQLLGMVSSVLFLPWYALLAVHMARIEGRYPMLAVTQFAGGAILVVYFIFCSMIWTVAAYRPDLPPEQLLLLHDTGWLTFVMVYPEYTIQLICIGVVGLMDKRTTPLLPRWVCYFNFWVALSAVGGGFASFFKTGPFAYNGLFAFWLPVAFFLIWLAVMVPALWSSTGRIYRAEQAAATSGGVVV